MSTEYNQSAQRARTLIEEMGGKKFGQDTSDAKTAWFSEAAHQVEHVTQELFKTMEDQEAEVMVQDALRHTTTTDYLRRTLPSLAEDDGTPVLESSVEEIFTCIKSMIMETWRRHRELRRQLLANSRVQVSWDTTNAMPAPATNTTHVYSEDAMPASATNTTGRKVYNNTDQNQNTDMMSMMSMLIQNQ